MGTQSITDLAQSWYRSSHADCSTDASGNRLFAMLYNTHCRRNGISGTFGTLSGDADHYKACMELYSWYAHRYGTVLKMDKGSQGQKRLVGFRSGEYTFNLLYSDDRQFKNYLLTGLPQSGSQDLLAFVLHTAVAFLVPLEELDAVLQRLGFHPLHVKNIHHLAIAYVLLMAENNQIDDTFNPFAEVERLYSLAHEILETPVSTEETAYSFANQQTSVIREMLLQNKQLYSQNFEVLISHNRAELNMRHSMILADFHKLSAVFTHIFDTSEDELFLDEDFESAYSFYRFVTRFCRENLSRKKYREELTSMIDRKQKHPTRNVLILLWLYAYCFSFLPGVLISPVTFRRITKQLRKTHPDWADDAKNYYRDDLFDVYGFIVGQPNRFVPQIFRGSDFISYLNEKLLLRYGWGALNSKLPFDSYIQKLEPLVLQIAPSFTANRCSSAEYDRNRLEGLARDVDNVPYPLVAVTQIFSCLADLHAAKAAQSKYAKLSPCPLKCGLYEQL